VAHVVVHRVVHGREREPAADLARVGPPPASRRDVDAVLEVVRGDVRAAEVRGGARVERAANAVTFIARDGALDPVESLAVALPGGCAHSRVTLDAWVETAPPVAWPDGRTTCVVDADVVGGSALVRAATAGDRFRPLGTGGTKTVFDALAERGVAASRRAQHLVLAADGNENAVLPAGVPWWVLGYRIDARARVTTHTRRFLWVTASPVGPRSEYDGNLANER
jgi:tRNA(Ile)-lysidine synthetase-like protein